MSVLNADNTVVVERPDASGRFVFCCEHAAHDIPQVWGDFGLTDEQKTAHIAWDPGALALARGLAAALDSTLVHGTVSRLVYDLNRPPHSQGAMPARSEIHDVPGNVAITPETRWARTEAIYLPFHAALRATIARKLALGLRPVLVTIHSFTPVYMGKSRAVEFGIIHDADPSLAQAVMAEALAQTNLDTRMNEPYSAKDEVTHTLALQATPMGIQNVMLEIRNDLIADHASQETMVTRLAPVLAAALALADPDGGNA